MSVTMRDIVANRSVLRILRYFRSVEARGLRAEKIDDVEGLDEFDDRTRSQNSLLGMCAPKFCPNSTGALR
jgi:hypothetical protein